MVKPKLINFMTAFQNDRLYLVRLKTFASTEKLNMKKVHFFDTIGSVLHSTKDFKQPKVYLPE